ncbi:MAG: type II toxin-antitoxin system Phd/YefM family antitoxin [Jatrophihabitans sp.]
MPSTGPTLPPGPGSAADAQDAIVAAIQEHAGAIELPAWPVYGCSPGPGSSSRHCLYDPGAELYDSDMATMNISDARDHLPDAMETARTEAVFVQRRGRLVGVIVSPERYEQLMTALEDAEDVVAFDAAMAEEGPSLPWEQVKADLGWQ